MLFNRVSFIRLLALFVLITSCAGVSSSQAAVQQARIELFAIGPETGARLSSKSVRVGREVREALTSSGRELLALRPAQVAAGGRVFVYAAVPGDSGMQAFDTEALVWGEDSWVRRTIIPKNAGRLGYVSATVLVPDIELETVPTAVFRRAGRRMDPVTVVTNAVEVPRRAHLRFSYVLDEWDLEGLSPVAVSVVVREIFDGVPSGTTQELFNETLIPAALAKDGTSWIDKSIDLGRLGGATVRFELQSSVRDAPGKLRPHVAWGPATIVGGTASKRRTSVVIVSLDGVRARSLGCCGTERATSPYMDTLFGEAGVIFDYAVTQSVESVPAHMTLMTGLYPSVHGVLTGERRLADGVDTLASRLSDAGYATAAVSDGTNLAAESGFGFGFETYRELGEINPWNIETKTGEAISAALDWVEHHSSEPFFLFLHLTKALPPYVPARENLGLFHDARLDMPSDLDEGALVRYEREVRHLDDAMKDFVNRLDEMSSSDSTLLIVTSGHGQEFLEHGVREAGTQLFDESIRVPLMMRGAGLRKGQRYGEVIGLIDVMPTVLEMTGERGTSSMQGQSIAKALRSGLPYSLPPRFVEARGRKRFAADEERSAWKAPAFAVVDSGHKVIMESTGDGKRVFKAYDLFSDRGEETDILGLGVSAPSWINELREDVENYPTECKRVARAPGKAPNLPVRTRLSLELDRVR
jgi:arylsulfatase A-like enzyme